MQQDKKVTIVNARRINKMRCIIGLIICSIVIVLTAVSLTLNIVNFFNESTPEAGLGTLRMYTTFSNIISALAAAICVPFQIEGLRKNKYKLPKWIVEVMYVGSVGTTLTLLIALSLIGPISGYYYSLIENSNIFMHTLNPFFIIMLFTVAISDTHIKFSHSFFAIIPTFIYSVLYFVLAYVTHIWRDHYHLSDFMPWPVAFVAIVGASYILSLILGILHNITNKHVAKGIETYYKESDDFKFDRVTDAIAHLAELESRFYHEGDDIYIPVDIIKLLSERYKTSKLPLDIQYDIYLENYLINIHKNEK